MKGSETHLSTEAISAFVDGELTNGARDRAARHIQTCFECAYAVGVQQQAKESLASREDDVPVPSRLMSRLGEIPFVADLGVVSLEDVRLYADESGQFEFRVAAPAEPKSSRTGFGHRRGRAFRGSAAAIAIASVVAGPSIHLSQRAPSGHQISVGNVVLRHVDQSPASRAR